MKLTIGKVSYAFKFGTKFVRELDKRYSLDREGLKFGMGLSMKIIPELESKNVNTLSNVLYLANLTEEANVTQDQLDNYIDDVEDIEALFDAVMKDLSESNAGKLATKNMKEQIKKAEEERKIKKK